MIIRKAAHNMLYTVICKPCRRRNTRLANAHIAIRYKPFYSRTTSRYCPSKIGSGGLPDSQATGTSEVQLDSSFILIEKFVDEDVLSQIMNGNKDIRGAYARNILIAKKMINYQEPFAEPDMVYTKEAEDVTGDDSFTLFPNPAKETFTIIRTGVENNLEIKLINLTGKVLLSTNFDENYKEISTKNLPIGLYLVNIYSNVQLVKSLKVTIAK